LGCAFSGSSPSASAGFVLALVIASELGKSAQQLLETLSNFMIGFLSTNNQICHLMYYIMREQLKEKTVLCAIYNRVDLMTYVGSLDLKKRKI
jgi:hypothetical protein